MSLSPFQCLSILDGYVLATDVTGFSKPVAERIRKARQSIRRPAIDEPDHRYRRLLRARRERPHDGHAAECGQQFPPSDGDCHAPLPREVRRGNDTTPRACCPLTARAPTKNGAIDQPQLGADKVDSAEGMATLEAMSSRYNFRPGQHNKLISEPPIAAPDEHAQLVEA